MPYFGRSSKAATRDGGETKTEDKPSDGGTKGGADLLLSLAETASEHAPKPSQDDEAKTTSSTVTPSPRSAKAVLTSAPQLPEMAIQGAALRMSLHGTPLSHQPFHSPIRTPSNSSGAPESAQAWKPNNYHHGPLLWLSSPPPHGRMLPYRPLYPGQPSPTNQERAKRPAPEIEEDFNSESKVARTTDGEAEPSEPTATGSSTTADSQGDDAIEKPTSVVSPSSSDPDNTKEEDAPTDTATTNQQQPPLYSPFAPGAFPPHAYGAYPAYGYPHYPPPHAYYGVPPPAYPMQQPAVQAQPETTPSVAVTTATTKSTSRPDKATKTQTPLMSPVVAAQPTAVGQNMNRCIPLEPPVPSRYWGPDTDEEVKLPDFHLLVNFPDYLGKGRASAALAGKTPSGKKHCVMCGKLRISSSTSSLVSRSSTSSNSTTGSDAAAAAADSNKNNNDVDELHIIPRQNKGVCTACDVTVWSVAGMDSLEIKWCKGCKNFRCWKAFGEKGLATKCVRCRERQKEKYQLSKRTESHRRRVAGSNSSFLEEKKEGDDELAAKGLQNLMRAGS